MYQLNLINLFEQCKTKRDDLKMNCCKSQNFCNRYDNLTANIDLSKISTIKQKTADLNSSKKWTTFYLLTLSIVLISLVICLTLITIYQKQKLKRRRRQNQCDCLNNLLQRTTFGYKLDQFQNDQQQTDKEKFDKQIDKIITNPIGSKLFDELELLDQLGNGEFTSKFKAKRHGIDVIVKIYKGANLKQIWLNEINIYKIILIRHENILNFVAKLEFYDQELNLMNYLTVTEYHQYGNLDNFLRTKPKLSEQQMFKLMLTASAGLNHLHLEISNNQRKPSIVHRNINPKNFIVKQNLTCALANFNYAVKSTELDSITDCCKLICSKNTKKCDKKYIKNLNCYKSRIVCNPLIYCPPEYLDNSINLKSIVSLKSADVYSFGLVLWQIANYFYTQNYRLPLLMLFGQFDELVANHSDAFKNDGMFIQNDDLHFQDNLQKIRQNDTQSKQEQFDEQLKRMKSLLLEQNKSSVVDVCIEKMFVQQNDLMKKSFYDLKSEETQNSTNLNENEENKINSTRSLTLKQISPELFRIIREACYFEPLSRLSIRKIENELHKLSSPEQTV